MPMPYCCMLSSLLVCGIVVGASGTNCTTGLTLEGLVGFDGDWIADAWTMAGAVNYKMEGQQASLTHGCILCNATEKQLANHTWAIWTLPETSMTGILSAVCTDGCPDVDDKWP